MKAIYINTSVREIEFKLVYVTQISYGRLVIREAVRLPKMPMRADLVIIDAEGYEAKMSAGYAEVFADYEPNAEVVGYMDMYHALRPIKPKRVFVRTKASFEKYQTNNCKNPYVAEAAREYISELKYPFLDFGYVTVVYGTSVETSAISIEGKMILPSFPLEHQTGIVNDATVAAAQALEGFFWSYYGEFPVPKEEKHKDLAVESVAILLGGADSIKLKANPDAAAVIARRYVPKFVFNDIFERAVQLVDLDDEEEKREEIQRIIFPYRHVYGQHDGDEREFTWFAPDEIGEISVGDRVAVETCFGPSEITVTKVRYSHSEGNHKKVLKKLG